MCSSDLRMHAAAHRSSLLPVLLTLLGGALLAPGVASAKDLNGRVGVGFSEQFTGTTGVPGLTEVSVRYGIPSGQPTLNVQMELDAGVDYSGGALGAAGGLRFLFGAVAEDNMNLYVGAGVGYVYSGLDPDLSAVRIQPGLEAQFFLFGLENLGFTAGVGLNVDIGAATRITTVGGAPMVGMHYWF